MGAPKYFYKSREQKHNYRLLKGFLDVNILEQNLYDGLCVLLDAEHKEDRLIAESYIEETLLNYGYLKHMANKKN